MILNIRINKLGFKKEIFVDDFSLKLKKGDFLILKGDTGCGKTSLLKAFCGLIPEVQDATFLGYITYGKIKGLKNLRRHISFAFQEPENQFILSTVDHELFFSIPFGKKGLVDNLLKYFRIETLRGKNLRDLSVGQRKILSIVSTLAQDKDIIILDEPTANLDDNHRRRLVSYLKLISHKKIIILTTHDVGLSSIGNKVITSKEGKWLKGNIKKKIKSVIFKTHKFFEDLLYLKKVSKTYPDGTIALKDINLNIKKGQIFGVFGSNGSGKSTLLNIITGNLKKSKGLIEKNFNSYAMIMQEPEKQLFANSVIDEIRFENNLSEEEALNILKKINLDKKRDEHPFFLSRGQKQLLLIASTLIKLPELLIIDEPFTGLDQKSINSILLLIKECYEKSDLTIIFSDQEDSLLKGIVSDKINLFSGRSREDDKIYQKVKNMNVSMLVVRPESFNQLEKIKLELHKREYNILKEYKFDNFSDKVAEIYSLDYPDEKIQGIFKKAYKESDFGERFGVFILKSKKGNTIKNLNQEIGHFKLYQTKRDNSLRSKFGSSAKHNYINEVCSVVFCGLHRTDTTDDFIMHLNLFGIKNFLNRK